MQRDQDQDQEDFRIQEGRYLRLKRALKFVTGMKEQNEGVRLSFPMTIPALDLKPFKYSSSSLRTFTGKIKKCMSLLTREDDFLDETKVQSWKTTLHSEHIAKQQVRNAFKQTTCKHLDAEIRDKILKLLTKKTIFNAILERAYTDQKPDWYPHCHTC